jgi:hypothetical protein
MKKHSKSRSSFSIKRSESIPKNRRKKDEIKGRTNFLKYRNAQIFLEEEFDFTNPDTLEAIVISYGYEKMVEVGEVKGVQITEESKKNTDNAMKKWLQEFIDFLNMTVDFLILDPKDIEGEEPEDIERWMELMEELKGINPNWEKVEIIYNVLKFGNWDEIPRSTKVDFMESMRSLSHKGGYILEQAYEWHISPFLRTEETRRKAKTEREITEWFERLSHLLDEPK